jgi:hypothetical protein
VQGASREARKQKKTERNPWHKRSEYLHDYLLTYLPTGASDLFSSSIFGSENSNFQGDSSNSQTKTELLLQIVHGEKSAENGLKFGPRTNFARPPPSAVEEDKNRRKR